MILLEMEYNYLLELNENLRKKIIGQDDAIDSVTNVLKKQCEVSRQNQPMGLFLFLGTLN